MTSVLIFKRINRWLSESTGKYQVLQGETVGKAVFNSRKILRITINPLYIFTI